MFRSALSQFRYAMAMLRDSRINVADIQRLSRDLTTTVAEFGALGGDDEAGIPTAPTLDPDVRNLVDRRRLRRAARKAAAETPYYARVFAEYGVDPAKLTLEGLRDFPITPKSDLRALPEAFVSSAATPCLQAMTTGTTGPPTSVWFSAYELQLAVAISTVALQFGLGLGADDVIVQATSSRAALANQAMQRACELVGAVCVPGGLIDPEQILSRLATPAHLPGKKRQVSILNTYPSYLGALMSAATRHGYRPADFGLERIVCGGEVLTDALARRAEEIFGAPVADNYSMTEIIPVAGMQCTQSHLHIAPDQGYIELLDPVTGEPVPAGEAGAMVVTPFQPYRETTLLFRYMTGDMARRLPDEERDCEYAGMPAVSPLLGKAALAAGSPDRAVYQRDVLDILEDDEAVPLPCRYSVVTGEPATELHVHAPRADLALQGRLEGAVAAAGLPIERLVLHDDAADVPSPAPLRCDLREESFTFRSARPPAVEQPVRLDEVARP